MNTPAEHWRRVVALAQKLNTDGCTGVPDLWFRLCCYDHDIAYRTGLDVDGKALDRTTADHNLRRCMAEQSPLAKIGCGVLSPLSWLYWAGVRLGAASHWLKERN